MIFARGITASVALVAALACAVPSAGSAATGVVTRSPEQARLIIPAIGVDVVVGQNLASGTIFWPGVVGRPGGGQVIAIAGHDVTPVPGFGTHGPFRYAYTLKRGARIAVVWHGRRYAYVVTGHRVYPDSFLSPFPPNDHEWLVLSTCWPAGSASHRMYVYARPV